MTSDLLSPARPFILPYADTLPRMDGRPRFCGRHVSLIGRLEIGANPWFGHGAVIRADGHFVRIGSDFRLGPMSTVHIAHDVHPTIVGDRVSVGRDSVVHACTVGDECVVEDEVVILDGSTVEDGVLVETGSIVFPRSVLKAGLIYAGCPAKPVRELELDERERRRAALDAASAAVPVPVLTAPTPENGSIFVAATASLVGPVCTAPGASVFFGCVLDGREAGIVIGENSNIQDNTRIDASSGRVAIGAEVTLGHNVRMEASEVGDRSLIGIGAKVAPGTVIDGDVLLAAGAVTTPGQRLEGGWLWGGRPARPLSRLDGARRAMMLATIRNYREYSEAFRLAQSHRS